MHVLFLIVAGLLPIVEALPAHNKTNTDLVVSTNISRIGLVKLERLVRDLRTHDANHSMAAIELNRMATAMQAWTKSRTGALDSIDFNDSSTLLTMKDTASSTTHSFDRKRAPISTNLRTLVAKIADIATHTKTMLRLPIIKRADNPLSKEYIICDAEVQCMDKVLRDVGTKKNGIFLTTWQRMSPIEKSALVLAFGNDAYMMNPMPGNEYKDMAVDEWDVDARALMLPLVKGLGRDDARAVFDSGAYIFGIEGYDLIYFRGSLNRNAQFNTYGWPQKLLKSFGACQKCLT